ncbi:MULTISPECIES: rhodanese-like domain-containing protein [Ferrimonas]|uniref:rhodanese-like domain-containing protein n=1 Tax=Ferrimonas TaxID=44011 RepID=UPI000426F3FC|nr:MULTISPECIES: rhodanese-like domain-containing protein [Ferrimonas]USD38169.1 rhodanese-like domain-containing protein [Ferrimonas sp. SCSIO 43195]
MQRLMTAATLALALLAPSTLAGGADEIRPADDYRMELNYISMQEAEQLVGNKEVYFFDVNTLELWAEGFIPGAVHFFTEDWKSLLPEDKNAQMIFYCANRLCNASEIAAFSVMQLGYTNVRQMPDGIYGWRMSGRPTEKP